MKTIKLVCAGATALAMAITTGQSFAEETVVTGETVTEKLGPSRWMLFSGVLTFGASYGAAAIAATASDLDSDRRMFIPFAGPWLSLSDRGSCGDGGVRSCNADTTERVLIITDGVFQAIGGLTVIGAFLNPETRTVTRTAASQDFHLRLTPSTLGRGGYGLAALGTF